MSSNVGPANATQSRSGRLPPGEAARRLRRAVRARLPAAASLCGAFATAAALSTASLPVRAADDGSRMCKVLQEEMPDCRCATAFLAARLGDRNAAIMLTLWVLAAGGHPQTTPSFGTLYATYGADNALAAAKAFLGVRNDFQTACRPFEGMLTDVE